MGEPSCDITSRELSAIGLIRVDMVRTGGLQTRLHPCLALSGQ